MEKCHFRSSVFFFFFLSGSSLWCGCWVLEALFTLWRSIPFLLSVLQFFLSFHGVLVTYNWHSLESSGESVSMSYGGQVGLWTRECDCFDCWLMREVPAHCGPLHSLDLASWIVWPRKLAEQKPARTQSHVLTLHLTWCDDPAPSNFLPCLHFLYSEPQKKPFPPLHCFRSGPFITATERKLRHMDWLFIDGFPGGRKYNFDQLFSSCYCFISK